MQIIYGSDKVKILNKLHDIKSKFSQNNIHDFSGLSKNFNQVSDLINSSSIFETEPRLVVIQIDLADKKSLPDSLSKLSEPNNTQLVIVSNGSVDVKKLSAISNLEIFSFDEQFDSASFDICDALFIQNDKKIAIKKILEIKDAESFIYPFMGLLQTYIRNLISIQTKNESSKKISPFFSKKLTRSNMEIKKLLLILDAVYKLDLETKSTGYKSRSQMLQDFVIYSF